jgi:hypothetical protein
MFSNSLFLSIFNKIIVFLGAIKNMKKMQILLKI